VNDRVADVGTLDFALDNSVGNIGGLLGYWSPDNANCRATWGTGTLVRLKIVYSGTNYYKFYGKVASITPAWGMYKERIVAVQAVDYMNELLVHNMKLVAVQTGKRGNELLGTIVANLPTAPLATSYATGPDIFAYALHDIQDENTSAMSAVQSIDQSGLSYTAVIGDTTGGETLLWQTRHTRYLQASLGTLTDSMTDFSIMRKADNRIFNTVRGEGNPVNTGLTNEVLWTSRTEIVMPGPGTVTMDCMYVDPSGGGNRIALVTGTGVTPAVGTDYAMGSSAGGGTDLNANLTVTVNSWGGNTANITLVSNATRTGYVDLLQLRGHIIRTYEPVISTKTDVASNTAYGDRALTYTMPYQNSIAMVEAFATTLLSQKKDPHSNVDGTEFPANKNDTLMALAMAADVGKRFTLSETVSGISSDFFINKYTLTLEPNHITCKLENLETVVTGSTIGIWGTGAGDATYWGPAGSGTIGNWVF
jgi:hypothetical protein